MKSRLLQQKLQTTRPCADFGGYIGVGSAYCHNLIAFDKETMRLSYALDTWNQGRAALEEGKDDDELLGIWDGLQRLIESGEIEEILSGDDEIDIPLPVYHISEDGEVIQTWTDRYGWPNTDHAGALMYENEYFRTPEAAIEYEIRNTKAGLHLIRGSIGQLEKDLQERRQRQDCYRRKLAKLGAMKLYG